MRWHGAIGAGALAMTMACAGGQEAPLSPSASSGGQAAAADGTTLKASAPTPTSPVGGAQIDTRRPTFTFNGASGRFVSVSPAYRLELLNGTTLVDARTIAAGQTSLAFDSDLDYESTYSWRVRAELDGAIGPWSATASFLTPKKPVPVVPGSTLPFPIPASCGPGYDPGNRIACASDIARVSAEWVVCARGNEVGCGRFVRQVIFALRQSEPDAWRNIQAAPGGSACNCNVCGPSDGGMLRSDTVVWNGQRTFDMIGGSGAPNPTLYWNQVTNYRAVDSLVVAPLCP